MLRTTPTFVANTPSASFWLRYRPEHAAAAGFRE
jgi:hypothetical protein